MVQECPYFPYLYLHKPSQNQIVQLCFLSFLLHSQIHGSLRLLYQIQLYS